LQNNYLIKIMPANHRKKSQNITIVDVAHEAGVSYSTVSRVLNGFEFVKGSTRDRVLKAAENLGYVANLSARSLAGGRTQVVGMLVPGLDSGYINEITRGIDEALAQENYDLMLYTTHRQHIKESLYVTAIANGLTDGLLLIVPLESRTYIDALQEQNFPYVLVDQIDETDRSASVYTTNEQGAYAATQYLIELGHRRIGFITGLMAIQSAVDRLTAYRKALTDYGILLDESLIVEGDYWQQSGFDGAARLLELENPPTAIMASNDLEAFGAMDAIRMRNLRIPEDISLIGYDDIPQASMIHPKLTTVRQPLVEMGQVAVQLLLEQINDPGRQPRQVILDSNLIIRNSCLPPSR
jgi:LacI family transcriptional regulator